MKLFSKYSTYVITVSERQNREPDDILWHKHHVELLGNKKLN